MPSEFKLAPVATCLKKLSLAPKEDEWAIYAVRFTEWVVCGVTLIDMATLCHGGDLSVLNSGVIVFLRLSTCIPLVREV